MDEDYCTGFDFGLGYRNLKAILFGNPLEPFCFSFKPDQYPELLRLFRVLRVLAFGLCTWDSTCWELAVARSRTLHRQTGETDIQALLQLASSAQPRRLEGRACGAFRLCGFRA